MIPQDTDTPLKADCNPRLVRLCRFCAKKLDLWMEWKSNHRLYDHASSKPCDECVGANLRNPESSFTVKLYLPNVKEHTTLSAGASVDHGVEVKAKIGHVNRAADRGCVSRLVVPSSLLGFERLPSIGWNLNPKAKILRYLVDCKLRVQKMLHGLLTRPIPDSVPLSPESKISEPVASFGTSSLSEKYTELAVDIFMPDQFVVACGEIPFGIGEQISNRREVTGMFEGAVLCARKIPFGDWTTVLVTEVFFTSPTYKSRHNLSNSEGMEAYGRELTEAVYADSPHYRSLSFLHNA